MVSEAISVSLNGIEKKTEKTVTVINSKYIIKVVFANIKLMTSKLIKMVFCDKISNSTIVKKVHEYDCLTVSG